MHTWLGPHVSYFNILVENCVYGRLLCHFTYFNLGDTYIILHHLEIKNFKVKNIADCFLDITGHHM